ncbi:MAG: hypothetical protein E7163_01415 [Firmicutes bacterium]|nr:hypothetical protein [Bacillota bacterium]
MNKIPYLHYKKSKNNLINTYFIALIPLILFGIYKNGILLYRNDLINFKNIFIPIYFYLISIIIGVLISLIYTEPKKENILTCLIISLTISINTNMIIYPILLFVSLFIAKYLYNKFGFNIMAFTRLLLILSLLINSYSYMNIAEKLNKFDYGMFDIFMGYGIGGIATTSLLFLIISFIILSLNKFYKKIIPIISSLTFITISFIYLFLFKDYQFINTILNGTIYFGFVFIATDVYTPNTQKGMIIYGIIIGFLTGIISIFNAYEASYMAILLASLSIPLINKIVNKDYYNA